MTDTEESTLSLRNSNKQKYLMSGVSRSMPISLMSELRRFIMLKSWIQEDKH